MTDRAQTQDDRARFWPNGAAYLKKKSNRCGSVCQFLKVFLHRFPVCTAVYTHGLHRILQRGLYGFHNIYYKSRKFCVVQISSTTFYYFQTSLQQVSELSVP